MTVASAGRTGKCPVCQASFRGVETCPRCGADLRVIMTIAAHAYSLRRRAQACLLAGNAEAALGAAEAAQHLQATPRGGALLRVCQVAQVPRLPS